jgi:predicted DNA-binding transcriptional regulator YafY
MSYGRKESPWLVMRRCLAIVRRLVRGPASGQELIAFVRAQIDAQAYSPAAAAARSAFKRDRGHLRHKLGVTWDYDPAAGQYVLLSPGELGLLNLPDEHLAAMNVLYSTFEAHELPHIPVKPFLDRLVSLLPDERRRDLARLAQVMRVEMPELDEGAIPLQVWQKVEAATRQHRQLAFNYYSPQQADRQPRRWVVAPVEIRFRQGHWYLHCWTVSWRSHLGEGHESNYRRFRLRYVADDERLEALPTKVATEHRHPPRYFVHYLLKPAVGRGDVSQYFDDMTIERQPDGSAVVKGFTDDDWGAVRTLLAYGESCEVLGGDEVLSLMRRRVREMARNYGFLSNS